MNAIWPHGDPRAVAHAILAEPRFRAAADGAAPGPTLWQRLLHWIADRFRDIFHGIDHALGPAGTLIAFVEITVTLAAAAGLVLLIAYVLHVPGRRARAKSGAKAAPIEAITSAQLLVHARRFAQAERWHDAASALVRAALLALDETGRLHFDPARTANEAKRMLRDPSFDAFEREATPALYAADAATKDRFARLGDAYARTFGVPV